MGWLASLQGHVLDLEVFFCCKLVDGFQVEVLVELECVSIWQLECQICVAEGAADLQDASRLEGEVRLQPLASPDHNILAVTHNGVGVPLETEARVDRQSHVAIFTQGQHDALGVGAHLAVQSEALRRFDIQVAGDQTTSHD